MPNDVYDYTIGEQGLYMIKLLEVSVDVLSVLEDDRLWTDRYEPTTKVEAFSRLFLIFDACFRQI